MNFTNQPIRKEKKIEEPVKKTFDPKKAKIITVMIALIIVTGIGIGIFTLVKSLNFSSVILSLGTNLHKDKTGHTNILLVGTGGEGHDGPDLTDSIIVASIDYDHKVVPMLSIPRDLYIKDKRFTAGSRINSIYSIGKNNADSKQGMENLKTVVSDITGIPIDYSIKVDFKGFQKIIDSLGGVDVMVDNDIYDTQYPLGETNRYQTFSLKAGQHLLDGETALKYARSRHSSNGEEGDISRAKRQQKLLEAIKEKALNLNMLSDPKKIQDLYGAVQESIETDLSITEIIEMAKIAKDFGKQSVISRVLSDHDPNCGSFLYQPPRELYGNAFVFLPIGNNYDYIHTFTQKFFENALLMQDESSIQVLNGTKTANLAGVISNHLSRFCFNVVTTANAADRTLTASTIYYKPGVNGEKPPLLDFVSKMLPLFKIQAGIPEVYLDTEKKQGTVIVIELGADYLNNKFEDPFVVKKTVSSSTKIAPQKTQQTTSPTTLTQQSS